MDIEPEVDSVRDDLLAAFEEHESVLEPEPEVAPEPAPSVSSEPAPSPESVEAKSRDATTGKFQKKGKESKTEAATVTASPAPKSWKAEEKALWDKAPPELKAIIERREAEAELGFTKMDEDRTFGKSMRDVITPYMATIQAEGGTPASAVQSLLNTAFYLRSNATPQEKGKMIIGLAKQFNADLSQGTTNPPVQPSDELAQTRQKLVELEQQIQQQPEKLRQQQEDMLIKQHIDAFAADPKNTHFAKLKPICASLLQTGAASSLQDAYEKACRADPEIYSMQEAERNKAAEAKRIADIKAKADKSRNTAVSVKGFPGLPPKVNGASTGNVRDDLLAAWDEHAA